MPASSGMTCREVEQAMAAHLERALSRSDRERLEAHCRECPACRLQVDQWRTLIDRLGRLENRRAGIGSAERERLVALFREQGLHRGERPAPTVPLGLDRMVGAPGDHIAYFWESEQEFEASAGFIAAGASLGEAGIILGHEEANERLLAAIGSRGIDPAELQRENGLWVVSAKTSADALLAELGERIRRAVDRGAPLVRVLGNLGWSRPGWPSNRELLRLEAEVTEAVRKLPVLVMCAYDVRGLSGRNLLLGGLECHPLICRRGALKSNDHHLPRDPFLRGLDPEDG